MRKFGALACFIFQAALFAQQPAQQAPPPPAADADVTFKATSQLVIETVTVTRNGKALDDLTVKDFTVTEDGVPQVIKFFEPQKLPDVIDTAPIVQTPVELLKK